MLKVVVFDNGWGGELVANFLEKELGTIEVIKVIDWKNQNYELKNPYEIYQLARLQLQPYIKKVDLIVLGGYAVSLAQSFLTHEFPEQAIVGMTIDSCRFPQSYCAIEQVALLMNEILITEGVAFREVQKHLPNATLIAPDCVGWEELIDLGEMTSEVLRFELQDYFHLTKTNPKRSVSPSSNATNYDIARIKRKDISPLLKKQICNFLTVDYSFAPIEYAYTDGGATYQNNQKLLQKQSLSSAHSIERQQHGVDNDGLHDQTIDECLLLKPQLVLLLNTHFWDLKSELSTVFGPQVEIVDFRGNLLHDVCLALNLRGVDGRLGRRSRIGG